MSREDEDRRRRQSPFFNRTQSRSRTRSQKGSTDSYVRVSCREWMLVEPRKLLSRTDEISYSPYLNRNKSKDGAVQTEPTDFSWNSPSPPAEKSDAWNDPALKDVPVRITNVKRRRLNKEYNWSRY